VVVDVRCIVFRLTLGMVQTHFSFQLSSCSCTIVWMQDENSLELFTRKYWQLAHNGGDDSVGSLLVEEQCRRVAYQRSIMEVQLCAIILNCFSLASPKYEHFVCFIALCKNILLSQCNSRLQVHGSGEYFYKGR
jgi:hypothetical protein